MTTSLHSIDWIIIGAYGLAALLLGSWFARSASRSVDSFFVGDRRLPWWLAGTSIVATTFAADTPLAVTGIVASGGISGNWLWWSWAIAHLVATFFFARLWRRSGVITDAQITELRYSGRAAAWLRAIKAVYFGLFVNCLTMAWVIAAMVKISRAFFDVQPALVIAVCVVVALAYTVLGGFRSVVFTDMLQFLLGMGGAVLLAWLVLKDFGGMGQIPVPGTSSGTGLLGELGQTVSRLGGNLDDVLDFVPGPDHPQMTPIYMVVLLLAGWWRYAEGSGYVVQRLAACRDEAQAQAASLWFAVAHNALRPWPWFLVALAAIVIYPQIPAPERLEGSFPASDQPVVVEPAVLDVATGGTLRVTGAPPGSIVGIGSQRVTLKPGHDGSLQAVFAGFPESSTQDLLLVTPDGASLRLPGLVVRLQDREMAYPLMMGIYLPPGLLGLVVVSLLAAFMSTIDTHTNWGASYLVKDLYLRFIRPGATQRQAVAVSRWSILLMGLLAGITALFIQNIADVWRFLITLGAGLGSVSAARWYWSRVTAHAELAAMAVTTVLAIGMQVFCSSRVFGSANPFFLFQIPAWGQILLIAGASLCTWVPVALWGPPNDPATLDGFARKVAPPGPGWPGRESGGSFTPMFLRFLGGLVVVYGSLFGIGYLVLGPRLPGAMLLGLATLVLAWILKSPATSAPPGRNRVTLH